MTRTLLAAMSAVDVHSGRTLPARTEAPRAPRNLRYSRPDEQRKDCHLLPGSRSRGLLRLHAWHQAYHRVGTGLALGTARRAAHAHQLRHGQLVETQASLEINEDTFPLHSEVRGATALRRGHPLAVADAGRCTRCPEHPTRVQRKSNASQRAALRPLHIVDIPGHEKLRFRLLDFERQVGGVVFVIDAAAVHSQLRQVRAGCRPPARLCVAYPVSR